MIGILSAVSRGLSMLREILGRPFREWSEWAAENPKAAAEQLEAAATVLRYRAGAYKNQQGWRARRDRGLAHALADLAIQHRERVAPEPLEHRCRVALEKA